jgi:hypothetical protein
MKQWLPIALKKWLWWVFKSPQRKQVGYGTLLTDIKGHWAIQTKPTKPLQPISICIGIKNRSEHLLTHLIPSLNAAAHKELITLSIYDAGSNDVPNLKAAIQALWSGSLIYTEQAQDFTRSKTFNAAILQSPDEYFMACDADIQLPKDIVEKINAFVTSHTAWFPQVLWLSNDEKSGRFFSEGTGLFASTKSNFIKVGQYDETITTWGKEDWLLYFAFYKNKIAGYRTNEREMVHHPHESLKPEGFEKLF